MSTSNFVLIIQTLSRVVDDGSRDTWAHFRHMLPDTYTFQHYRNHAPLRPTHPNGAQFFKDANIHTVADVLWTIGRCGTIVLDEATGTTLELPSHTTAADIRDHYTQPVLQTLANILDAHGPLATFASCVLPDVDDIVASVYLVESDGFGNVTTMFATAHARYFVQFMSSTTGCPK
jgi:hypothetical protein